MTDSANFQTQMSEIWKARREREMYRLDLEKEVFVKKQRREKRRDELKSKVKALHDDLVREDITSSQRVKILLSKVESLKREHQILAAHTERLKLKKRQIELQLVTSYPIIHQTVHQEVMNSHLPVVRSQGGNNVFLQTPQASEPPQLLQHSLQLQQQQQQHQHKELNQPYNVKQLGGVGDTVYRGIPGIISTINSGIDNNMSIFPTRGRSEDNTQANQPINNEQFDIYTTNEGHKTENIQKYLNSLENRIYSNPRSSTSEYLTQMTNNSTVNQNYNHPVESTSHISTQDQVLDQQFRHTPRTTQGSTNREDICNPSSYSIQRGHSNYSSKHMSEQVLYSHHENDTEIQPQLRSNLEINSNKTLLTAHNLDTHKTPENSEFINPSYDVENLESSSERYPITKENESITNESYIEKPSENIYHDSRNQRQTQESNYHQHISEEHISNEIQQNLYQNQGGLKNVSNNDIDYEHYENSYSDGNHYDNYKTENYNSHQNLQNYRENGTDSSFNAYSQGDYNQTQNEKEFSQESQNIRYQTEGNHYNMEYQQDLQNHRENEYIQTENKIEVSQESQHIRSQAEDNNPNMEYHKNSSESQDYDEYVIQDDYIQTENKEEVSQESQHIRSQAEENNPNMEYHKNSSESQNYEEYVNQNTDEEHNYNNIENKQVEEETVQSISNNQTITTKASGNDESLTSTIKQEKFTKQYTDESNNGTSSFSKDKNILDEDSDFFEKAAPVTSSTAYQKLLGVAAPSVGIESDSDEMEGHMAAMALKPTTGLSFKGFASTIPSLKPSAAILTDSDSVDSVEAAIQASMNKKANQESSEMKNLENNANISGSTNGNPVPVTTAHQSMDVTSRPSTTITKPKGPTALQINLSDDESYNVSGGGGNDSYDDDDDFFD